MKITPRSEAMRTDRPMGSGHFTGSAHSHELIPSRAGSTSIFGSVVRFDAGARNHWHSHPGGQLLHVVEGEGWVQVRGQAPERIRQGDIVASDPGEEHWHGAGASGPMAHLAVAVGETVWLEEAPPPPS